MAEAKTEPQLFVQSHTARDLLQSAALFKTDKLAVWEYVSNSVQYVDPGRKPVVKVTLDSKKKRMTVSDNGRGMDWDGLENFFIMHGENIDRLEGRGGRGRFGTGKSAAFGIGDVLRITTIRHGKRSKVELTRQAIESMKSKDPIPVQVLEREVSTGSANGTLVEIEGVHLRSLDQAGIIHYIERHLARWPNVTVFVNNHECEFTPPPVAEEFRFQPDAETAKLTGDVELMIKVSKSPLDEELRGVAVFSKGVWYETTLAGSEGRDMSQYIFGDVDLPALDEDTSPIPPFDMSRSMRLNPENELVQAIYSFVGRSIEEVRAKLVEAEKARKASEEAKKLQRQASEIAKVINKDFDLFRQKIQKAKAKTAEGSDLGPPTGSGATGEDDLLFGGDEPAEVVEPEGGPGSDGEGGGSGGVPDLKPKVRAHEAGDATGKPAGGEGRKPRSRGGFDVRFEHMGEEEFRAKYFSDERTILINLDHPQLSAAKGSGSTDELTFRRLAYEVAFSEYSIALASELANRNEYLDPSDPIFDIRESLNRLARKAAELYAG